MHGNSVQTFRQTFHSHLSDTRRLRCVDVNESLQIVLNVFILYTLNEFNLCDIPIDYSVPDK